MWWLIGTAIVVLAIAIVLFLVRHQLVRFGGEVQVERARELFLLQRERIQQQFLPAAAATGKPRGLRWTNCEFDTHMEFARDKHNGQMLALVGVAISFEAIAGSDMEGLPAVANLRNASAVFFFHRGQWLSAGKAVFNMNPDEAIRHFDSRYERIPAPTPTNSTLT
jgi:hypothetical protein